jgi:hypothetical protein
MTLDEAKAYITAAHIYANVTPLETVNCPVSKYLTEVGGVTLLGTEEPYEALASKELVAP